MRSHGRNKSAGGPFLCLPGVWPWAEQFPFSLLLERGREEGWEQGPEAHPQGCYNPSSLLNSAGAAQRESAGESPGFNNASGGKGSPPWGASFAQALSPWGRMKEGHSFVLFLPSPLLVIL